MPEILLLQCHSLACKNSTFFFKSFTASFYIYSILTVHFYFKRNCSENLQLEAIFVTYGGSLIFYYFEIKHHCGTVWLLLYGQWLFDCVLKFTYLLIRIVVNVKSRTVIYCCCSPNHRLFG